MNRMGSRFGAAVIVSAILWLVAAVGPCAAAVEGLLQIPTADLTPAGALNVELTNEGTFGSSETDTMVNTQYGVSSRLAVGLDIDPGENGDADAILNAKYLLATETIDGPRLHSASTTPESASTADRTW